MFKAVNMKAELMKKIQLYSEFACESAGEKAELQEKRDDVYHQFGFTFAIAIDDRIEVVKERFDYWNGELMQLYLELDELNKRIASAEIRKSSNQKSRRQALIESLYDKNERMIS